MGSVKKQVEAVGLQAQGMQEEAEIGVLELLVQQVMGSRGVACSGKQGYHQVESSLAFLFLLPFEEQAEGNVLQAYADERVTGSEGERERLRSLSHSRPGRKAFTVSGILKLDAIPSWSDAAPFTWCAVGIHRSMQLRV